MEKNKTLLQIAEKWCNNNIASGMDVEMQKEYWEEISKETEHFGDCTNNANSCLLCHYIMSIEAAIKIMSENK